MKTIIKRIVGVLCLLLLIYGVLFLAAYDTNKNLSFIDATIFILEMFGIVCPIVLFVFFIYWCFE